MADPNEEDVSTYLPPTSQAGVGYYLPRLIAGEAMHPAVAPFIHGADVYNCAPRAIAARFFFTTIQRLRRGAFVRYVHGGKRSPGYWTSREREDEEGVPIGVVFRLRYVYKYGVATDWLMDEYHLCGWSLTQAVVRDREPVFCRIFVDPHAHADSEARHEPAAFFHAAPPLPEEEPTVMTTNRKRPIAARPPCPKRVRAAPMRRTMGRLVARRRRLLLEALESERQYSNALSMEDPAEAEEEQADHQVEPFAASLAEEAQREQSSS